MNETSQMCIRDRDDGRISGFDTHENLLRTNEIYCEIYETDVYKRQDYKVMKDRVMEEVKHLFKPEFINRIDEIIVFHPLNKGHMKDIVTIMLKEIMKRTKEQMNIRCV